MAVRLLSRPTRLLWFDTSSSKLRRMPRKEWSRRDGHVMTLISKGAEFAPTWQLDSSNLHAAAASMPSKLGLSERLYAAAYTPDIAQL